MIAEYKRDMNHNYLVLTGETEADTASYPVRMLLGNIVPSLVKCHLQGLNGKSLFYYEITSRQSLAAFYENRLLGTEDLQMIFECLVRTLEKLEEYLLDARQLILNPDYVFLNLEKKELCFCYFPGYDRDVGDQFRMLVEYLLPRLDHGKEQAVSLGYGIYRKALADQFCLEEIRKELYQVHEEETDIKPQSMDEFRTENDLIPGDLEPDAIDSGLFTRGEDHRKWLAPLTGCALGAGALLAILAASQFGYLPAIRVEYILGCALAGIGTGIFIYQIPMKTIKKRKKEEAADKMPENAAWEEQKTFPDPGEKTHKAEALSGWEEPANSSKNLWETAEQDCNETVVLSAGKTEGPASLVSREPGEFATIYLKEELTVIGKMKTASDAVIPLPTVSRIHAKIRKRGEDYYLTDLNSRNGTSVNGQMLRGEEEYLLQDEDEVDFAQARFIFLK